MIYEKLDGEKQIQYNLMKSLLQYINKMSDRFVLKGGTALMLGYGLDRFSEDIDLDGFDRKIGQFIEKYCDLNDLECHCIKNTSTVIRYMIKYNEKNNPLKVEVSFKEKNLDENKFEKIDDINIYNINNLLIMKNNAYNHRDKIRDLYDIVFILNNYKEQINEYVLDVIKDSFTHKGLEQFDYLIQTQSDPLIDNEKLAMDFLSVFDKLELFTDELDYSQDKEEPTYGGYER